MTKSIPDQPEDAPEAYLRQLAAYRAALAPLYPGRTIETGVLWTSRPRFDLIPAAATDAALARIAADLPV